MEGWKKLVAGALIGVAGTVYATDEEARRNLPKSARDLPENLRRRFDGAVLAGREAAARRRQEILHDLDGHGGGHRPRRDGVEPAVEYEETPSTEQRAPEPPLEDVTEPIPSPGGADRAERGGGV